MKTILKTQQEEYKQTELGLLPKEWKVVRLGDVAEKMKAGGTPRRGIKKYWNGKIPFVLIEDMTSCGLYLSKTKETITEEGLKNSSAWLVPKNSLLLSMYATIGETAINTIPLATNQAILAIIPKDDFDVVFGAYLLKFSAERLKMQNIQSTQKNVNKGVVENFKIPLPPLQEQKAIAFVLSTIQTAKEKTEQVIQATKELKKSLMKHLFTYGPVSLKDAEKVKLKETEIGKIPEGWEESEVKKHCKLLTGGTPNTKIKGYWEPQEIPWMKSGEIQGHKITSVSTFISKKGLENSNARWLPKKSVVIALAGRGKTRGTTAPLEFDCTCNQSVVCMKPDEKIDYMYLHYYLAKLYYYIRRLTGDKDRSGLNKQIVGNIPLFFPNLQTQKKIASILSAVDEKIEKEENKKKALEELFKSMLYNLMSAKIRVKDLGG